MDTAHTHCRGNERARERITEVEEEENAKEVDSPALFSSRGAAVRFKNKLVPTLSSFLLTVTNINIRSGANAITRPKSKEKNIQKTH